MNCGYWKILAAIALLTAAPTSATSSTSENDMARELTDVATGATPLISDVATACGVDLVLKDLRNEKSSDPMACWTGCRLSSGCNAVTWTSHEGGTCWYKQWDSSWVWAIPNSVPKTGAISYFEYRKNGNLDLRLLSNYNSTDMPGYDIGNAPEKNAATCVDRCFNWNGCFAVTWSSHEGGTCWFKSMASNKIQKGGLFSYAVMRRGKFKCQ